MQRGALGARAFKADLQRALNPNTADMIMQTENDNRKVFGAPTLGRVVRINREGGALVRKRWRTALELLFIFNELLEYEFRLSRRSSRRAARAFARRRRVPFSLLYKNNRGICILI